MASNLCIDDLDSVKERPCKRREATINLKIRITVVVNAVILSEVFMWEFFIMISVECSWILER